jgi:hypothetical protein
MMINYGYDWAYKQQLLNLKRVVSYLKSRSFQEFRYQNH